MHPILAAHLTDLLCLLASAGLYGCYHLFLQCRLRRDPFYTMQAYTELARKAWVASVMTGQKDLLAIQTLRNATMAATFLASTAIILAVGVLSMASQTGRLIQTWHVLTSIDTTAQSLFGFKLLLLVVNLFGAFFSFSMSVRLYNHLGFLINTPSDEAGRCQSMEFVALELNRAARHFHKGLRAYYFMMPLLFWLYGSAMLLLATAGMIAVMFWLDRTPRVRREARPRQADGERNHS
ncbi:DUF599 domain-containing protein [Megalodesulfovibrio gigas]|uniref:DUF599 domain-containing protein n=1 Tax=Megalodesulfovibrio gigas (strain ATCC 19364 / DSM 1382 / NCIMB 9332 / VKM B-1759) TaxID=1121448 RepID=T2G9Z5_MEGG1|nr:DUF599 domain-containing protein [Megalodesulfovibrio gigas]AGW13083.1 putative protein of unknown function [Megalodesulfovibrio gigas DSM 1382 = ATCC 19364]